MENIFQSKLWEQFKLSTGYQKSYWVDNILVLQKNLPFGFSMLYSPRVSEGQVTRNKEQVMKEISRIAQKNNSIFYRLEMDIPSTRPSSLIPHPFIKSFEEMQPEHTLTLDLDKSEAELLSEMKQKGRYNIKIAERSNLNISSSDKPGKELDDFYTLYAETGKRHRITYRSKLYFDTLLEILGQSGYARVYTAYAKTSLSRETPLASAIIVYSGKSAIYMFGSSSDENKNLMAPYLLHWQIIKEAKADGYKEYDFFGIAPDDNPRHPWAGVTRFKKQFGGREETILGSYDLPLQPIYYQLFKFAEKIRRHQ